MPGAFRHRPRRRLGPLHRRLRPRGPRHDRPPFEELDGWSSIHDPSVIDFIARYQLTADSRYCAYPDATLRYVRGSQNWRRSSSPRWSPTPRPSNRHMVSQACHHVERSANQPVRSRSQPTRALAATHATVTHRPDGEGRHRRAPSCRTCVADSTNSESTHRPHGGTQRRRQAPRRSTYTRDSPAARQLSPN